MKIAICDDDRKNCLRMKEYILSFVREENIPEVSVETFFNPSDLLDHYPKDLDLLILDIEMPGVNGIQAAREIRTFDPQVLLIYMTNYAKYAIEGYSVQAYNYLLKPITSDTLFRELKNVFRILQKRKGSVISLNCKDGYHTFSRNEIEMIETQGKNVLLYTRGESYLVYRSMKQMEELLETQMFRIHTSYMVSMDCVRKINKDTVLLKSGKELPISRQRKKEFLQEYMNYIGGLL